MLASPIMAHSLAMTMPQKKEVSCCAKKDSTHHSENSKDSKSCKDDNHCQGNCPKQDCCVYANMLKNYVQQSAQKLQIASFPLKQINNEYYLSFHFKDISYSFWHPPKYIS